MDAILEAYTQNPELFNGVHLPLLQTALSAVGFLMLTSRLAGGSEKLRLLADAYRKSAMRVNPDSPNSELNHAAFQSLISGGQETDRGGIRLVRNKLGIPVIDGIYYNTHQDVMPGLPRLASLRDKFSTRRAVLDECNAKIRNLEYFTDMFALVGAKLPLYITLATTFTNLCAYLIDSNFGTDLVNSAFIGHTTDTAQHSALAYTALTILPGVYGNLRANKLLNNMFPTQDVPVGSPVTEFEENPADKVDPRVIGPKLEKY